jgi:hypothetical protein
MPVPSDWHASRRSWNLEQNDPPTSVLKNVNIAESEAARAMEDLHLVSLQALQVFLVCRPDDGSAFVVDAKHEPASGSSAQVCFIRKSGNIFSQLSAREPVAAALELYDLVFPVGDEEAQLCFKSSVIHYLTR